jgi:hypothetical protein
MECTRLGVSTVTHLVAFYDIHGRKILLFSLTPQPNMDIIL